MADCGRLLCVIEHRGAAGLEARVLRLRASAALQLRRLDEAEADLSTALAAQPGDAGAMLLQAEVGPLQLAGSAKMPLQRSAGRKSCAWS